MARANLCYKVFKRLNLFIGRLFYQKATYRKWKGFRVLAVDGSTIPLPNHASLRAKFSTHQFGRKKSVSKWMSRVSFLYDVLNKVVIDAQMESFNTSEATLCNQHLGFLKQQDLVLFDRYYASHYLLSVLTHKKVQFLFRMRLDSWKAVSAFVASTLNEQTVELEAYKYSKVSKKIPANVNKKVKVRLVKHRKKNGEISVYATSLLDEQRYSRKSIISLYRERWTVEEAYKLLKARLDVIHFSGKTIQAVQQDFYANVLLISLASVLKFNIKAQLKTKTKTENKEHRKPMINNTYALAQAKKLLKQLFFDFENIHNWLCDFILKVGKQIEYSRKGQNNTRKKDKGRHRTFNQNYKPI